MLDVNEEADHYQSILRMFILKLNGGNGILVLLPSLTNETGDGKVLINVDIDAQTVLTQIRALGELSNIESTIVSLQEHVFENRSLIFDCDSSTFKASSGGQLTANGFYNRCSATFEKLHEWK